MAIVLPRARWMADVIAMLPDSDPRTQNRTAPAQIRLVNAEGMPIYLWGAKTEIPKDAKPVSTLHLSSPLRPWQLQHFGPSTPFRIGTSGTLINLLAGGGLFSVGLLGLAFYLSREIGRQTRDARQRVNFVNQVSHELKTPLTNIRMYADLLEHDLQTMDSDDARARSHLAVITGESSRLSRLINNVLTFSHLNRDATQAKSQPGNVDKIIEAVVEQFHPSLEKLGIEVALDLDADQQVALDADGLEQMLGNLISNVEKYAAEGKHIRIASRFKRDRKSVV
jgi:signal transduction histidine kinase